MKIIKHADIGALHVYCVSDKGYAEDFYVALLEGKRILSFYGDSELKQLLRTIDMDNPDEKISVPEVPTKTVCCVLSKCLQALKDNYFPLDISYCA